MSEMSSPAMSQPTPSIPPAAAAASSVASPKKMGGKINLFSHIKYEHMVAGVSGKAASSALCRQALIISHLGGVTSTLILHPLDLIKIRFAGEYNVHFCRPVCSW